MAAMASVQQSDLEMDLLKEWVQTSYQRVVWEEKGPTRTATGWTALAAAFGYSRLELRDLQQTMCTWQSRPGFQQLLQQHQANEQALPALCRQEVNEDLLRAVLVETYSSLRGPENAELRAHVLKQKKNDSRSLFHHLDAESAEKFFDWYLYCLSCPSNVGRNVAEEIMQVPLDYTDLQVIADAFFAQITVLQYSESPIRFKPGNPEHPVRHRLLLAMHHGIWVPLLEPKMPEDLVNSLKDSLVRLKNMPSSLQALETSFALVKGYDQAEGAYRVLVEDLELLVDCDSLGLEGRPREELRREYGGCDPCFGIPDGALEFFILLQMVCQEVGTRLETTKAQLANRGTGAGTAGNREAGSQCLDRGAIPDDIMQVRARVGLVKSLRNRPVKCLPLREVLARLERQEPVTLCALVKAPPQERMLSLDLGEFVKVTQCNGADREFLLGHRDAQEMGWCRSGAFCVYKATSRIPSTEPFMLSLEVGDIVLPDSQDGGATITRGRVVQKNLAAGTFDRTAMEAYVFIEAE